LQAGSTQGGRIMTDYQRDDAIKAIVLNSAETVNLLVEIRDAVKAQQHLLEHINTNIQNVQR
jgi:t-SNARE complex subunit (syntaxin)